MFLKRLFILVSLVGILVAPVYSQDDKGISEKLELAIKAGNAHELAKLLNSSVDLNIPDNEGVYSKAQAELILKDFFSKNNPQAYKTLHKGSSKDGARYSIGNLETDKGVYRTYIYMKKKDEVYFIHEFSLNIEKNDE